MTDINRRDAIKMSTVSALGGVVLGGAAVGAGMQSSVAACIEAHRIAETEMNNSDIAVERAQRKFREMRPDVDAITLNAWGIAPRTLQYIWWDHEAAAREIKRFFTAAESMEQYAGRTDPQAIALKQEALKTLEAHRADYERDAQASGMTEADQRQFDAYTNEDKALVALLASQPQTPAEASAKGDYLRQTHWLKQTIEDEFEIEDKHLAAMFKGMGCGEIL